MVDVGVALEQNPAGFEVEGGARVARAPEAPVTRAMAARVRVSARGRNGGIGGVLAGESEEGSVAELFHSAAVAADGRRRPEHGVAAAAHGRESRGDREGDRGRVRESGPVGSVDRPSQVLDPNQWVRFNPLARGNLVILPNKNITNLNEFLTHKQRS